MPQASILQKSKKKTVMEVSKMHESQWLYWKGWRKATDFCTTFHMFFSIQIWIKDQAGFQRMHQKYRIVWACKVHSWAWTASTIDDGLATTVIRSKWSKNVRDTLSKAGFLVLCKTKSAKIYEMQISNTNKK